MCFNDPADRRHVYGSVPELNAVTVDEAVNFYKNYYLPSNAVSETFLRVPRRRRWSPMKTHALPRSAKAWRIRPLTCR
jgi:hypothetical protein